MKPAIVHLLDPAGKVFCLTWWVLCLETLDIETQRGDHETDSFLCFTSRARQGPDSESLPQLSRKMAEDSNSNGTVKPFRIFREQLRVAPRVA